MNNIMLDLETMGNGSNAAIIAIGAVRVPRACGDEPIRRSVREELLPCSPRLRG